MSILQSRRRLVSFGYFSLISIIAGNFVFAAISGDYGVFRQAQASVEIEGLSAEKAKLQAELDGLKNLTHRLSDDYLDVDLLDEQVRSVLGYVRADEIVIR